MNGHEQRHIINNNNGGDKTVKESRRYITRERRTAGNKNKQKGKYFDVRREYIFLNGVLSSSYIKLILRHFLFAVAWSPHIRQNSDTYRGFHTFRVIIDYQLGLQKWALNYVWKEKLWFRASGWR